VAPSVECWKEQQLTTWEWEWGQVLLANDIKLVSFTAQNIFAC